MIVKQKIRVFIVILLFSILNAAFFFAPSTPILGRGGEGFFGVVYEAFFHTGNPEILFGEGTDPLGSFWIVTKVRHMLTGQSETSLMEFYYPIGFDIGKHEGFAWGDTILSIPWELLIGKLGFYNFHLFQTICLSFIGCTYLARTAGAQLLPSLLLAHLATIHTFTITELSLGRPTQVYWIFQCIFLIGVIKIVRGERPRIWAVISGVSFAWACLVYWFGAVATGFCAMLVFVVHCVTKRSVTKMLICGGIIAFLSLFLTLLVTARVSIPILLGTDQSYLDFTSPPELYLNFFFFYMPILGFGDVFEYRQILMMFQNSGISFSIWALLALNCLFGLWKKETRVWSLIAAFAATIPIGAALRIGDAVIPTAFAFLHTIFPPLIRCTDPSRMVNTCVLFSVIAFAMILYSHRGIRRIPLYLLLSMLFFYNIQYFPKEAVQATRSVFIKTQLHELIKKEEGGLIHVPFRRSEEEFVENLWHNQVIFGGPGLTLLRSEEHRKYEQENQFLSELLSFDVSSSSTISHSAHDIQHLIDDGFLYVIFHKKSLQRPLRQYVDALQVKGTMIEEEDVYIISLRALLRE